MSSDDWNDFVEGEYISFAREGHDRPPMETGIGLYTPRTERYRRGR